MRGHYAETSPLDRTHLNLARYFDDAAATEALRTQLVFDMLRQHLAANSAFAAYARRLAGDALDEPSILRSPLAPLLPSSLFKQAGLSLRSVGPSAIVKRCISSGTSGSVSTVERDEATLLNFMTSITSTMPALFDLERTADYHGVVLGPSTEEAGDLWFSYVISCVSLLMPTTYCEVDGSFAAEAAAGAVREQTENGESYLLIGPPHRILQICEFFDGGHVPTCPPQSYVISAGGWKALQEQAIDATEFRSRVRAALRIENESQIRDSFNMVELNSVISECSYHRKHIPPWLLVQSRNPKTNEVLADGEVGVLSFMDGGALSYPCFVLSEDFGVVDTAPCRCGRAGGTFRITRRMKRIEQRGCALKMAGHRRQHAGRNDRFFTSVYREQPPRVDLDSLPEPEA